MPILKKLTPEQMKQLLASPVNSPIKLTPIEKFNKIKLARKGKYNQIRRFHFSAIVTGKEVTVFDGNGISIAVCSFDVSSIRNVRVNCLELFKKAKFHEAQGGYLFTIFGPNLETLTEGEIEK